MDRLLGRCLVLGLLCWIGTVPTVHAGPDADGDGVLDDSDNCPQVANNSQSDDDGDDVGDECDVCPSEADPEQQTQIRLTLPGASGGDAPNFRISPDGTTVVFLAVQDTEQVDLYAAPILGGTAVRLNDPLPENWVVQGFEFSPDSSHVVFRVGLAGISSRELYSIPAGGGVAVRLDSSMVENTLVFDFEITPDSSRVVYLMRESPPGAADERLFSVPIAGGDSVQLSDVPSPEDVDDWIISADSSLVVYRVRVTNNESILYAVPTGGGEVVNITPTVGFNETVTQFDFALNDTFVVYIADQQAQNVYELYATPVADGLRYKLSAPLPNNADVENFRISPDGSTVVYMTERFNENDLFSVPTVGGAVTQVTSIDERIENGFRFTDDSTHVLYLTQFPPAFIRELYKVPAMGGPSTRLNSPLASGRYIFSFELNPDGTQLVYQELQDPSSAGSPDLYHVPLTGDGPSTRLTPSGMAFNGFRISPDGTAVTYRSDQETEGLFELYRTPIEGGVPVKLSRDPADPESVVAHDFSPDGAAVVYQTDKWDRGNVFTALEAQPDIDSDGRGDACDNCFLFNPNQVDMDTDGTGDECDCDVLNDQIWDLPGPATVDFADAETLQWPAVEPGGVTVEYDTIRSTVPSDFVTPIVCIESADATDTSAEDLEVPQSVFYYVVRAKNACGGTTGPNSSGTPRTIALCP